MLKKRRGGGQIDLPLPVIGLKMHLLQLLLDTKIYMIKIQTNFLLINLVWNAVFIPICHVWRFPNCKCFYIFFCRIWWTYLGKPQKKVLFLVGGLCLRKKEHFVLNMALLAEKCGEFFFMSKSVSGYFKTNKKLN